ncbi:YsnF/AvaK domain-containing protein [Dyadobacter sp. CY343]|uniref:YsnF/AvaK domain-containing protein n=1 Tax=Dyadobacter sp. CY343 TaxID=2907299 RepID=UPI001F4243CD|nr:YsnF/AvaK domain-containing protein [Dyadobacter sp. CY343]MCE7059773.1 YsnF/AvaK domain-containing protein [Dyadobacter sp. CY343]
MSLEGTSDKPAGTDLPVGESYQIPVIRERLVVGTERVETSRVLVSKEIVEEQAQITADMISEEVLVERRQINQYVEQAPPAVRQEGDVTIISVMKEVLVVEKKLMLVEELHITKREHHDQETFTETIREEKVVITRNTSGTDI